MIDGFLNALLLFISVWDSSLLSIAYGILGLFLFILSLRPSLISGTIYRSISIYAILATGFKALFLIIYICNSNLDMFNSKGFNDLLGISYQDSVNLELFLNFYKELIALIIGILGLIQRTKIKNNPQVMLNRSVMGVFVMINLILVSLSYYSLMNTLYFTALIIWVSFWGYRVNERFLTLGIGVISSACIVQILVSGAYSLIFPDSVSQISIFFGILTYTSSTSVCYFSTLSLFFTSATFIRRLIIRNIPQHLNSSLDDDLSPLLVRRSDSDEFPSIVNQILTYLSFTLVYGVCVFNIFLWITNLHGYLHLLMMIWLFYSIIETDMDRLMIITRKAMIPIMIVDCCILYLLNLANFQPEYFIGRYILEYSYFYILYQLWTISMFLLLQRRFRKKKYDITKSSINVNLLIGIILENSNKVSLIVVFIIGLNKINLFNVGFMVIFLVFMLNSEISRKYWIILVIYSQVVLFSQYVWGILDSLGVSMPEKMKQVIGFDANGFHIIAVIFTVDYLDWILLLSAAMQLSAYRSSYIRNKRDAVQTGTESKLIIFFAVIYEYVLYLFVWLVYAVLFITIFMASLNILNGIRLVILITLFSIHVFNTMSPLHENMRNVEKNWYILIYYSGIVLVIRYLFQFNQFINYDFSSDLLGINVYGDKGLYENMLTDCIILFISVYQKSKSNTISFYGSGDAPFFSVADLIKNAKNSESSSKKKKLKDLGAKYFIYIYFFVIIIAAIFWRLAISMMCYLISISIYALYAQHHTATKTAAGEPKSIRVLMKYRAKLWSVLMFLTITFLILSYLCFFCRRDIVSDQYDSFQWAYFILGFSLTGNEYLLQINYIYFIIFILLTAERHFIDTMKFYEMLDPVPKNPKISLIMKISIECFVPSLVLAAGFYKLTLVNIIYSLAVIFTIRLNPLERTKHLLFVVIVTALGQYLALVINLSKWDSPYETPNDNASPLWTNLNLQRSSDVLYYYNLGNDIHQTYGLIGDFMIIWILTIFYTLFSMANSEIATLYKDRDIKSTKRQRGYREIIYSSMHFTILFIVLIFISESSGFFSLCYCIFCLISVFYAMKILKYQKNFKLYVKLLRNFLIPFMCFELFCQSIFQIPFHDNLTSNDEKWLDAIGLVRLWNANSNGDSSFQNPWKRVYFKIFTLGFILLVFWLMNTEDYKEFVKKLSATYRIKAKKLGLEIAQKFNDTRLKLQKRHEQDVLDSEKELERLDENVAKWNEKYLESRKPDFGVNQKRGDQFVEKISYYELLEHYRPGFKRSLQNLFISQIHPVLFKHFIYRIKLKKNNAIVKEDEEELADKKLSEISESSQSQTSVEKEKIIKKLKKKQHVYILSWKDWVKILLFVICSSTQGIVFIFFFINHTYYASLESVIFPLSVLLYGLIEYPRPSPNYFRIMLIYAEFVFFIKFVVNLYVWSFITTQDYNDEAKIGFNVAANTYSTDLTTYVLFDAICMLSLLAHEYFLMRCGLNENTEIELETLAQARVRNDLTNSVIEFRKSLEIKTEKRPKLTFKEKIKEFLDKIGYRGNDEKPGYDYYTRTVLIQLLLLLYILFFYSQMDGELIGVENIFVANTFAGSLVIALMFQSGIMFTERYLYLDVTSQESSIGSTKSLKFKFYFHVTLVLLAHGIIFWEFPLTSNLIKGGYYYCIHPYDLYKCNNFQINTALIMFYLLYLCYFVVSACQIKYGAPKSRAGEFVLMKNYNTVSNIMFLIYRGLPFLYEIRTLVDWTFTATALTLFQWFKFEEIYSILYNTKCDQIELAAHPRGKKLGKCDKIFKGCCFLSGILLCILAPLIIFSSLNPIVFSNPVKTINMQIGAKFGENNFYGLASISIVKSRESISRSSWNKLHFNEVNQLSATDSDFTDKITLENYSDTNWIISQQSEKNLLTTLQNSSQTDYLQVQYTFYRDYPPDQQYTQTKESIVLTEEESLQLYKVINGSETNFTKGAAFSQLIRLLSTGTSLNPILINSNKFKFNVSLIYTNNSWEVTSQKNEGVILYIISEDYSPVTFNFSVITFYISVVYLIGRVLRIIVAGGAHNIPLTDMPNPDPLINVCAGIYISRMNGDLYREEMLYYELIDILRSPEIIKMLTGSSSIKRKDD